MHVEELPRLRHGAKQWIVTACPLFPFVKTDSRAFCMRFGA
jgi:hypothetical protein